MKSKFSKYMNIYVVGSLIGVASLLYMFSFMYIQSGIMNGSSLKIKQEMIRKGELKPYCKDC